MKYKILVVDDMIESLQVIVNFIQRSNPEYTIYQSNSSVAALKIASKTLPDVIITDWDMPVMDGIELIRKLKQENRTKDIPIIMATGVMLTSDNLKLALEAGAFDYIRKPIDPIELTARIHSAITIIQVHRKNLEKKNRELAENALYLV
ncbi:MAG: response regulator [Marinilabiliaceae bacterium]|nr:response regulator [Marinilabiliaceae bacterium]